MTSRTIKWSAFYRLGEFVSRLIAIFILLCGCGVFAAEVIPPAPQLYFNDYAGVVSLSAAGQLNQKLADFERASSSQVVVAVFSKMQSDSSIEDYSLRVARAWKVGQADKKNGIVLFVFVESHQMFIQVGYGLEGALPDALCKRIISDEIAPRFKQGDFDGGMKAGINAILAATKGEYQGNGTTVAEDASTRTRNILIIAFFFLGIGFLVILFRALRNLSGWVMGSGFSGWSATDGSWSSSNWSSSSGGSSSFDSGSSSSSDNSFSGGGGDFGGGGAGGSW